MSLMIELAACQEIALKHMEIPTKPEASFFSRIFGTAVENSHLDGLYIYSTRGPVRAVVDNHKWTYETAGEPATDSFEKRVLQIPNLIPFDGSNMELVGSEYPLLYLHNYVCTSSLNDETKKSLKTKLADIASVIAHHQRTTVFHAIKAHEDCTTNIAQQVLNLIESTDDADRANESANEIFQVLFNHSLIDFEISLAPPIETPNESK